MVHECAVGWMCIFSAYVPENHASLNSLLRFPGSVVIIVVLSKSKLSTVGSLCLN